MALSSEETKRLGQRKVIGVMSHVSWALRNCFHWGWKNSNFLRKVLSYLLPRSTPLWCLQSVIRKHHRGVGFWVYDTEKSDKFVSFSGPGTNICVRRNHSDSLIRKLACKNHGWMFSWPTEAFWEACINVPKATRRSCEESQVPRGYPVITQWTNTLAFVSTRLKSILD